MLRSFGTVLIHFNSPNSVCSGHKNCSLREGKDIYLNEVAKSTVYAGMNFSPVIEVIGQEKLTSSLGLAIMNPERGRSLLRASYFRTFGLVL